MAAADELAAAGSVCTGVFPHAVIRTNRTNVLTAWRVRTECIVFISDERPAWSNVPLDARAECRRLTHVSRALINPISSMYSRSSMNFSIRERLFLHRKWRTS